MASSVVFRFQGALNDFLPVEKRNLPFQYFFLGNPSLKDAIESSGPPHPEVAGVILHGSSVGWNLQLEDGWQFDVYPHPSPAGTFPLQPDPAGRRFVLDVHLGKLATYLRMTGFDSLYSTHYSDKIIVELAAAEERIILTRDIQLLKRNRVKWGYWLRSQDSGQQLREVFQRFQLHLLTDPFSRCLDCNGVLSPVEKDEVGHLLPPRTLLYFNEFFQCTGCCS